MAARQRRLYLRRRQQPGGCCHHGLTPRRKGYLRRGAALCGPCKTENLGLEKVIANVIANPNIRFMLFCGTEVKGHLSGQTSEHSIKTVSKKAELSALKVLFPSSRTLMTQRSSASRNRPKSSISWKARTSMRSGKDQRTESP